MSTIAHRQITDLAADITEVVESKPVDLDTKLKALAMAIGTQLGVDYDHAARRRYLKLLSNVVEATAAHTEKQVALLYGLPKGN